LQDSYAAICVVEAFGKVGVPMSDLGSLRQLLDHEHVLLQMLAADAAALERIATPLAALRDKLSTMTFMNVGNPASATPTRTWPRPTKEVRRRCGAWRWPC
jgi:hypothetical protein